MGIKYGINYFDVTDLRVSSVSTSNCTVVRNGDVNGKYLLEVTHPNNGCGSQSGVNIYIDDFIDWRYLSYKVYLTGTASCWRFNEGTGYGTTTHNILGWDPNQGDTVGAAQNCWELGQYTLKMSACDNNADNFFHSSFHTGSFKSFIVKRRRDTSTTALAGPAVGRTCSGSGTTIISDIRVWK